MFVLFFSWIASHLSFFYRYLRFLFILSLFCDRTRSARFRSLVEISYTHISHTHTHHHHARNGRSWTLSLTKLCMKIYDVYYDVVKFLADAAEIQVDHDNCASWILRYPPVRNSVHLVRASNNPLLRHHSLEICFSFSVLNSINWDIAFPLSQRQSSGTFSSCSSSLSPSNKTPCDESFQIQSIVVCSFAM